MKRNNYQPFLVLALAISFLHISTVISSSPARNRVPLHGMDGSSTLNLLTCPTPLPSPSDDWSKVKNMTMITNYTLDDGSGPSIHTTTGTFYSDDYHFNVNSSPLFHYYTSFALILP